MNALSPRSIVASVLLGSRPPRLPGRLLVAFAEQFGIRPGTTRTALSRMVQRGELQRNPDGSYELRGPMLERHRHQESVLAPYRQRWDQRWEIRVVPSGARAAGERSEMRQHCSRLGLWERRDGIWLRPANLDPDRLPDIRAVVDARSDLFFGEPDGDPRALLHELVDLDGWATRSRQVMAELDEMGAGFTEHRDLVNGFELAVSALRQVLTDPLLPPELMPAEWPAGALRRAYDQYLSAFQAGLRAFFRTERERSLARSAAAPGPTVTA